MPLHRRTFAFWAALIAAPAALFAAPVITEFMASNKTTLADEDGDFSDWIELHNPDPAPVDLTGWFLTDNAAKKDKWKFPAVILPPDGYLVVFASDKKRTVPTEPLHTNFSLSADGEYLALVRPDGTTVVSEYFPSFPAQFPDVSYGVTQPGAGGEAPQAGYFSQPTPGERNGDASALRIIQTVAYSRPSGLFSTPVTLKLSGAIAGQTIRYVVADPSLPNATIPDPDRTATAYTGPLTLTTSVVVKAAVFSSSGDTHGPVTSAQFLKIDTTSDRRLDTFSSQLPLVVLDNQGYGSMVKDGVARAAWFYAFRPSTDGKSNLTARPDHISQLALQVRGASSSYFPKRSYKFDLVDESGSDAPQPLFGLPSLEDWNLVGPWSYDRSYIRNSIVYELTRRMGRWAPRTQLVELFFNQDGGTLDMTDYAGIYVLTDKIEVDPKRINITKISASDVDAVGITGGYLLRVDEIDPEKYHWMTKRHLPEGDGSVLMVEEPKAAKLPQAQRNYIRTYVQEMEDAIYSDHDSGWAQRSYLDYLDRPSWVDYHLINTLVKNTDAFWRSAYFTKDRNGRIFAGPVWDYDRCMDSTDPRDDEWDTWELTPYTSQGFAIRYWETGWWGLLARDPDFMQAWIDRWQSLRQHEFSDANLGGVISDFANQIGPAAAARDAARWADNQSVHGDFAGEIKHLSEWLTHRAQWIDGQFIAAPAMKRRTDKLTVTPSPGALLAYTLDGTDPRAEGGELAAGAMLSPIALSFENFGKLRARSYSPDRTYDFPGSPWSSLVAAPVSTEPGPPPDATDLPVLGLTGGTFTAVIGKDTELSITPSGSGPFTYQWYKDGIAIKGATANTLPLTDVTVADAGNYTVKVSNLFGTVTSSAYQVRVATGTKLVNISARADIGSGDNVLIAGFVVGGTGEKSYLARAVGPSLRDQGVLQAAPSSSLNILNRDGMLISENKKWGAHPDAALIASEAKRVGAFSLATNSNDAALIARVNSGAYTLHSGPGEGAGGIALVELYALDENSYPENLSARARVRAGDRSLIGGFVIGGTEPQRVLIRAVGPTLAKYDVPFPLGDPVLEIVSAGKSLHFNDNWDTGTNAAEIAATAAAVGAFPLPNGSKDASILVTLPPGIYTVLVKGKNDTEGIALLEIYAVED